METSTRTIEKHTSPTFVASVQHISHYVEPLCFGKIHRSTWLSMLATWGAPGATEAGGRVSRQTFVKAAVTPGCAGNVTLLHPWTTGPSRSTMEEGHLQEGRHHRNSQTQVLIPKLSTLNEDDTQ